MSPCVTLSVSDQVLLSLCCHPADPIVTSCHLVSPHCYSVLLWCHPAVILCHTAPPCAILMFPCSATAVILGASECHCHPVSPCVTLLCPVATLCHPVSLQMPVTGCYCHPAVTLCYPASLPCHFVSPAVTLLSPWLLATELHQHLGCWCNPVDNLCCPTVTLCHTAVTLLSPCATMSPYFYPVLSFSHPALPLRSQCC